MTNSRLYFSFIFLMATIFLVAIAFYFAIDLESVKLYESESYRKDTFLFTTINVVVFLMLCPVYNIFLKKLVLDYAKGKDVEDTKKALPTIALLMALVIGVSTALAMQSWAENISDKYTKGYDLDLDYDGGDEYKVYKIQVEPGKRVKLGTGVEISQKDKKSFVFLGRMTCERSMKECSEMVVKNKEQIESMLESKLVSKNK